MSSTKTRRPRISDTATFETLGKATHLRPNLPAGTRILDIGMKEYPIEARISPTGRIMNARTGDTAAAFYYPSANGSYVYVTTRGTAGKAGTRHYSDRTEEAARARLLKWADRRFRIELEEGSAS